MKKKNQKKEIVKNNDNNRNEVYFKVGIVVIILLIAILANSSTASAKRRNEVVSYEGTVKRYSSGNNYNNRFEEYFGESVYGERLVELLDLIIDNNRNSDNLIGLDINIITNTGESLFIQDIMDVDYIEYEFKPSIVLSNNYYIGTSSIPELELYSEDGRLRRITIIDENNVLDEEVNTYNNDYEEYYNDIIEDGNY